MKIALRIRAQQDNSNSLIARYRDIIMQWWKVGVTRVVHSDGLTLSTKLILAPAFINSSKHVSLPSLAATIQALLPLYNNSSNTAIEIHYIILVEHTTLRDKMMGYINQLYSMACFIDYCGGAWEIMWAIAIIHNGLYSR